MKKSKTLINSGLVLLLSIFLVWYFLKDNYKVSLEVLHNANLWWLLLAIIIYLVYFLLETLLLKKLVNNHKKDLFAKIRHFTLQYDKSNLPEKVKERCCDFRLLEKKCHDYIVDNIR